MTISALTSAAATTAAQLVQTSNGEYTADSVAKDQTDASKLGLIKEKDGNYGTTPPTTDAAATAASQSSSGALSVLSSLKVGGE